MKNLDRKQGNSKNIFQLEDILSQQATFFLDNSVFNKARGDSGLTNLLEKDKFSSIPETAKQEIEYLNYWIKILNARKNFFTVTEVVDEASLYSRKIGKHLMLIKQGVNIYQNQSGSANYSMFWNELRDSLSGLKTVIHNLVFALQSHAFLTSTLEGSNKFGFENYFKWLKTPTSLERKTMEDYKELYEGHVSEHPSMDTDEKLTALSLISAWNKPAVLLTGDGGLASKAGYMYGYPSDSLGEFCSEDFKTLPELPPHHYQIYVGFEQGWKLWVDSKNSPVSKGEFRLSRIATM